MLTNYQKMDINMLLSIVNMKLRDEQQSLENFCIRYQLDKALLLQRLASHAFIFDETQSQFKQRC